MLCAISVIACMSYKQVLTISSGDQVCSLVMKLNFMDLFRSSTGTQTVRVGKIELESVVPNSQPETHINVRGQSLTERR